MLVDYRTSDDAGVYALDATRALVQTVDFFTPIVDDPFVFGQIAAANALSDVYAMGGRPLTALAVAGFPKTADRTQLKAIFAGGLQKLEEAGVALLGGHTVQDNEIKFGYAVTGEVDRSRVWTNAGARVGDVLLLTKRLGTGIITTALKYDRAPAEAASAAITSMMTLNAEAARIFEDFPADAVHACTDITGFGLIGHAIEMAAASGCTLEIDAAQVPLLDGVLGLVQGNIPGGGRTNAEHFSSRVRVPANIDDSLLQVLYDPQTSGGLLLAIDGAHADAAVSALHRAGVTGARIGRAVANSGAALIIR